MLHLLAQQSTDLSARLQQIDDPTDLPAIIECRQLCLDACRTALEACSAIAQLPATEQIPAYKLHVPAIFGHYYHYSDLQEIHLTLPDGPASRIRLHYESWLSRISQYRASHAMPWDYYRLAADGMDNAFFTVNGKQSNYLFPDDPLWVVSGKVAPMAIITARFRGYDLTAKYVMAQLQRCDYPTDAGAKKDFAFRWTGSKAALVELIYALQEQGVFNEAKPEIGKLTDFFSTIFSIDMGNIYKMYENCRLRKKNRTAFLDSLRASLIRRMEEDDLNAP